MAGLTNPMQPPAPSPAPVPQPGNTAAGPGTPPPAPGPGASPAPQPGQQQQPKGPPITDGPVDPELYKKFVANCMNVVTGSLQAIAKMIGQAQDKPGALAHAAVQVVMRVEDGLEQAGGKLVLTMTFNGGAEALSDIVDAMQKMGVYDFQQKEIDAAFLQAVDQYRMIRQQQGRLDPAMFQQQLQQLKQQEQQGTLDQTFPGLTQYAKKAQQGAKPAYQPGGAQPPAPAQGEGDAEDQQDGGDDEAEEGDQPAAAQSDSPEFKAMAAKKAKPSAISVKAHFRNRKQKGGKKPPPKMKGKPGGQQPPMRQPAKPKPTDNGSY